MHSEQHVQDEDSDSLLSLSLASLAFTVAVLLPRSFRRRVMNSGKGNLRAVADLSDHVI